MSVTVKLNLSRLRRVLQGTPAAIDRGAKAYADAVKDLAIQLSPVDTGFLRSQIHVEPGDRQGTYRVVSGANYSQWVEYGSSHASAQPFLTPALRHISPLPFFAREFREMIR